MMRTSLVDVCNDWYAAYLTQVSLYTLWFREGRQFHMESCNFRRRNLRSTSVRTPCRSFTGFLHIYHYNECYSSEYHSYDDTYKFTILISRLLHFYHICLCGTPQWLDTLAHSQQDMRNVMIAPVLLLSSPFPTGGSHSFSHYQMGPLVRLVSYL